MTETTPTTSAVPLSRAARRAAGRTAFRQRWEASKIRLAHLTPLT